MHVPALLHCTGSVARGEGGKKKISIIFFPYLFQVGFTSAPGQGGILAQREFDRRFSPHFVSTFQLVIEIAPQQPMQPSTVAFCQFVVGLVWFALQSPGKLPTWIAINPNQLSRRVFIPASSVKELALWDLSQKL